MGLSAMNGFERELNNRILAVVPTVKSSRLTSRGPAGVMPLTKWKRCPALRRLHLHQLYRAGRERVNLRAIQVKGVNPRQEERLSALPRYAKWRMGKL